MDSASCYRPRKPLITYSRKPAQPLLPLDGSRFLTSTFSTSSHISNSSYHEGASPSHSSQSTDSDESNLPSPCTPSDRPRLSPFQLALTSTPECDRHDPASPLSEESYDFEDAIEDIHNPADGERSDQIRAPRMPLSIMRKHLKLSYHHPPNAVRSKLQSTMNVAERKDFTPGSDGFTAVERLLPTRSCPRRKYQVKRRLGITGKLDIRQGPHPDVDFITKKSIGRKPDLNAITDGEAVPDDNQPSIVNTTRRVVSYSDRMVYAQLSSIHAPKHSYSTSSSVESDNHLFQADFSWRESSSFGRGRDTDGLSEPGSSIPRETCYKPPGGELTRRLLDVSRWNSSVDEDVLDDGLPDKALSNNERT